jgi:hypothetical protein
MHSWEKTETYGPKQVKEKLPYIAFFSKSALYLACFALFGLLVSCSESGAAKKSPPFNPDGTILTQERSYFASEPAGMTGHQQIFAIWDLGGTTQAIEAATSDVLVRDKLYWLKGPSVKLDDLLKFFDAYSEYQDIRPDIREMLSDPNVRYAYENLEIEDGSVRFGSVWICAPKAKRLAYLDAY